MTFTSKECTRLDITLSHELDISRSQIEKFIKSVGVIINGKEIFKPSFKIEVGDIIEYAFKEAKEDKSGYKVHFDVQILYEDNDILIINKPPHVVIHSAPSVKEATLVDWLKQQGFSLSTISGQERYGIVHRIDKETSGALVVAKSNEAHAELSKQLEDKSMGRYYLAMIDMPLRENIIVEKNIARNPKNRLKMAIVKDGRYAKSSFIKLVPSKSEKFELIAVKLHTGRTHQIRVHLSSLSRHILGDSLYGFKSQSAKIDRVMLHAYILYLKHPVSGKDMQVRAPLFDDFRATLCKYFDKDSIDENIKTDNIIDSFNNSL